MAKTLLETYRELYEANKFRAQAAGLGAAQAAPSPDPIQAKPLGGSSSVGTSSVVPSAAPSQAKIDKSRSLQNANLKPGTNTTTASKPVVDLSKPGIGPGSQGDTGSKNTVAKSTSQAVSDTSSYAAQSQINKSKLDTSQAAQKPTTNVKTPMMDKAVADKTAADNAARVSAVRRPAPAPVRPGDKVSGEKVATNSKLTGQAMARKGFGNDTGGGNYPAARSAAPAPVSRTPGRGDNTGGKFGMQRPEISKAADQPYGMNIPEKSPTLTAQMDGNIGGKFDVAPDKKPLAKPADQPYGMNTPTMSPTLTAQMKGNITDKKPADQDTKNPNGAGGGNYKAAQTPSVVSTGNPNTAGGIAPVKPETPPKPTLRPSTTKKPGVVKKPNASAKPARKPQAAGTQNNMTTAQRAIINRRVERGNARPGEELIGLGVKTKTRTGSVSSKRLKKRATIGQSNKNLGEMVANFIRQKLEEGHSFTAKSGRKGRLVPSHRYSAAVQNQSTAGGKRYRIRTKPLTTEEAEAEIKQPKKIKHKKGTPVNLDPETNSTNPSY